MQTKSKSARHASNAPLLNCQRTAIQSLDDRVTAEPSKLNLSLSREFPKWILFHLVGWPGRASLLGARSRKQRQAPLSAALANDDTLSITADCYSIAAADAALAAALLAYYTSSQVDALLGDYRTASAQHTQTQAAITGALLAYRTARTRTSSQPPRRWWRTVRPQTRTRQRPQASQPRCSATTPSHKWTVCWPTSSASRRQPLPCK